MSVGVGRGRGRLPQQLNGDVEPLRRPNMATVGRGKMLSSPVAPSKFSDVEAAISDTSIDTLNLFKAIDFFLKDNPSNDDIQILVKKIFEKTIRAKMNSDCICKCVYLASKHKQKGEILHVSFFDELEKRFGAVDSIKDMCGPGGLWRFTFFFSSVCHFVRSQKTVPFEELIVSLNKLCLNFIHPTTAEESKIASLCIARCCHYLRMSTNVGIESLLAKLRSMIYGCNAASDPNILLWLTLGLESALQVKLPDDTLHYYCRILGPEASAFNLQVPPVNLPKQCQANYNFQDISLVLNFC